ncbi:MAG: PD-(D/E)XK nuclease family protein [Pseudomonadota bacterium]|nr:PD-(D/E)XK nuclease family protein [Pseudomonadota bacterium]
MNPALHSALAEGAAIVTPNRRLARFLHREFDVAQRSAGRTAWPTPTILPYPSWLASLWDEAILADAVTDAALLLTPAQAAILWRRIVDTDGVSLLYPHGAAMLAAEAWTLVHEWGAGGESWRAWRGALDATDDASIFVRWAEQFLAALRRIDARDLAQVPEVLAPIVGRAHRRGCAVVMAGFIELTPQQERLCAALVAAGTEIRRLDTLPAPQRHPCRTIATTPRDELVAALGWARAHVVRQPAARIGIVVEDLAHRRNEVLTLAEDILCPGTILPGAATSALPFEISLGVQLASVPVVATALDLIALAGSGLAPGAAAVLLRSPYLPAADQAWSLRAGIERDWLHDGCREVTLGEAIAALATRSPELALQWRAGREAFRRALPASPREWADAWRAWLVNAGWPGSRPLDSGEYQARETWEHVLGQFASLGAVMPKLEAGRAIEALRTLLQGTVFQPEGSAAPIEILGVLEGTGLTFDALWVAGLTADRWPPAPVPNPLLPIAWQRERDVPRASAKRELKYAEMLTSRFAVAATEVVFSSAASADDHELSPSPLILEYPEVSLPPGAQPWWRAVAESATLETIADDRAPPLAAGSSIRGGSRIVAIQSDCPFQAAARHRLGAEPWPRPLTGLSRLERGLLVHAALAAFWSAVAHRAAMLDLDAAMLAARIDAAVQSGLEALPQTRWRHVPPLVRESEARRLAAVLAAWLAIERNRPPFVVQDIEALQILRLGGLEFRLRVDRVDALADGGLAVLDYKTGRVDKPGRWFDARPRAAQLGMYTLAQRAVAPELPVRAAAYVQLCPGAVYAVGVTADEGAWPGLSAVGSVGPRGDWTTLETWWHARLGALAAEIAAGHASVTPRASPSPCRSCGLQALCRIESVRRTQDGDAGDE